MSDEQQFFTVEEASKRLPLVKSIVRDIVALHKDVTERRRRLEEIRFRQTGSEDAASLYREEVGVVEKELKKDVLRLDEYIGELRQLNVILKDANKGLVDFPAKLDGREVYLCWQHGEEEVGYWHDTDKGYAGRQSLMEGSVTGSDESNGSNGE